MNNLDGQYFELVERILNSNNIKSNRTEVPAYTIPGAMIQVDMEEGFPLMTSKYVPLKIVAAELEGFIKGVTSKKWFQERHCHIWDEWCSPETLKEYNFNSVLQFKQIKLKLEEKASIMMPEVGETGQKKLKLSIDKIQRMPTTEDENKQYSKDLRKLAQLLEDDLGPIYGSKWNKWDTYSTEVKETAFDNPFEDGLRVDEVNQLQNVIEKLKTNLEDRRMVVSAWDIADLPKMALPPCHLLWQVTVINGKLNLFWYQRSVDVALGLPFNVASYGLLLELLAKECKLIPGTLTGFLADTHIYVNHEEEIKQQIVVNPYPLPHIMFPKFTSFFEWQYTDFELIDYRHFQTRPFEVNI